MDNFVNREHEAETSGAVILGTRFLESLSKAM